MTIASSTEKFRRHDDPLRIRVLSLAPTVLHRVGLTRFTMDEVAKAAGVARQTVYKRFATRDDLIVALLVQDMETRQRPALREWMNKAPSGDRLVEMFIAERAVGEDYPFFEDVFSPSVGPKLARLILSSDAIAATREATWAPVLELYIEHGIVRSDISIPKTVRWLTYETFWLLIAPDVLGKTPEEVRDYTARFTIGSILTEAARDAMG